MFRECLHCLYFMKLNIYAEQTLLHMFSPIDPSTIKKLNLAQKTFSASNFKSFVVVKENTKLGLCADVWRWRFRATMSVSKEKLTSFGKKSGWRLQLRCQVSCDQKLRRDILFAIRLTLTTQNQRHKSNAEGFVFTSQPNSPLESNQGLKVTDTISKWNVQLSDSIMSSERERS